MANVKNVRLIAKVTLFDVSRKQESKIDTLALFAAYEVNKHDVK